MDLPIDYFFMEWQMLCLLKQKRALVILCATLYSIFHVYDTFFKLFYTKIATTLLYDAGYGP